MLLLTLCQSWLNIYPIVFIDTSLLSLLVHLNYAIVFAACPSVSPTAVFAVFLVALISAKRKQNWPGLPFWTVGILFARRNEKYMFLIRAANRGAARHLQLTLAARNGPGQECDYLYLALLAIAFTRQKIKGTHEHMQTMAHCTAVKREGEREIQTERLKCNGNNNNKWHQALNNSAQLQQKAKN